LATKIINLDIPHSLKDVFGHREEYLRLAEKKLNLKIVNRGNMLRISGREEDIARGTGVIEQLLADCKKGYRIEKHDFELILNSVLDEKTEEDAESPINMRIEVPSKKRFITPRTPGQIEYVRAIRENDVVFAIGPAGTGKTYLSMAAAVSYFTRGDVSRMILARPAVEAGERLGFLPGDITQKVSPYLRPLYDALYEMMDITRIQRNIETGLIELAPLAFMRGRNLNDAFIILDEAQNTTSEQMMMFLTRLGFNSKAVITGDITQVDLPADRTSGLIEVQDILREIDGIKFCYLTEADVVRHEIVQKIVQAYNSYRQNSEQNEISKTLET